MAQQVKPWHVMPASYFGSNSLLMYLGKQPKVAWVLGPCTYMGDLEEAQGSWLHCGPPAHLRPPAEG